MSVDGQTTTRPSPTAGVVAPTAAVVAPTITTQPTDQRVGAHLDATFTAEASGNPTPSVQWQLSTDGGGSWGNIAGATSTSYTFMVNANDQGFEYRAVFTNVAGSIPANAATLTVPPDSTSNMSGYFEYSIPYGTTFSQVRASWTVPTVSCPSGANTWAAEWPGIGYGTSVVQDGTQVACFSGVPNYSAWYELVGDSSVNGGNAVGLSASSYPVSPGDAITASVGITGSTWTLSLEDTTQGWTFTFTTPSPTPALQQESAQVTVEGPSTPSSYGLANFGAVHFTGISADLNGQTGPLAAFSPIAVQMTSGSTLRAAPGPLDPTGEGFTDIWYAN